MRASIFEDYIGGATLEAYIGHSCIEDCANLARAHAEVIPDIPSFLARESVLRIFDSQGPFTMRALTDALHARPIPRVGLLVAHGTDIESAWSYEDVRGEWHPVQDWIDRHSAEYGALLIACCNTTPHDPVARAAPIFYPYGGFPHEHTTRLALPGYSAAR